MLNFFEDIFRCPMSFTSFATTKIRKKYVTCKFLTHKVNYFSAYGIPF